MRADYDKILAGLTDTATLNAYLQRLEMEKDDIYVQNGTHDGMGGAGVAMRRTE